MSPAPRAEGRAGSLWVEGTRFSIGSSELGCWEMVCSVVVLEAGLEDWFRPVWWEGWEGAVGSVPDMSAPDILER